MPLPGSQELNHLDWAYFLHTYRWYFRIFFGLWILTGSFYAFKIRRKWLPLLALIPVVAIVYLVNFKMQADKMFKEPKRLIMASFADNKVESNAQVVGIEINGDAKAYPIKFLAYHHIVYDTVGGESIIITYCSVCHSGRIFNNNGEKFRLVGMDHFNAMFEDRKTGSWWRQATGECIAGKRKGEKWSERTAIQITVQEWFNLYPQGKVMQIDPSSIKKYDLTGKFEQGKETGSLERTDSLSWQEKSLVIGVTLGSVSKAYDWRELLEKKIINDTLAKQKIVVLVYPDKKTFAAYINFTETNFEIKGDTLIAGNAVFDLYGRSLVKNEPSLQRLYSYQEFWHSWRFFHPTTLKYGS